MKLAFHSLFKSLASYDKLAIFKAREKGLYDQYCPLTRTHIKYLERKIDEGGEAVNGVRMDCLSHRDICNVHCGVLNLVYLSTRSRDSSNARNR